ncbi:chemotaxis protein CheW [Demequina sp.]|uniref:chemotaxis protein CheW n=1 Tax=Demequina sp. TaxID=2050685 RepID=UPI003A866541
MDEMDEIVREFVVESRENLDRLDRDLVELESASDTRPLLSSVFRAIHTIKGTSGFLGFSTLEAVTHVGESLLADLRDGRRDMSQRTTDVLLEMVDAVRDIVDVIDATGAEGEHEVSPVVTAIQAILDNQEAAPTQEGALAQEAAPTQEGTLAQEGDASTALALPPASEASSDGDEPAVRSSAETSIRIDVDVLDALMRHVGELVLARNAIVSLAHGTDDVPLVRAVQRLSVIAGELQQGVMKTRMQPIDHVWAKVPRMVREVSAALGRSVQLQMVGKDTELDRSVLEAIKDPLTHLVRNAIDHGIEVPQVREAAGKPATGALTLRAYHQGGQVVIEVTDDGKGIDHEVIAAKAVDRGLRTPEQVAQLGAQDLLQLLFLPGFSTAEAVTHVSGRGVGMDVVKTKIDAIGGVVEVQSVLGAGTTWRLRLPLTLAIMPALTVDCAGQTYAIPQANLLELLAIDAQCSGIDQVGEALVLRLRGALLPLVDLRDVLQWPARASLAGTVVAVMQGDGGRFGLIVDHVRNTEEVVAKPLAGAVKAVGVYAGATLLGDGRVALILDIPAVARRSVQFQDGETDTANLAAGRGEAERMLVVSVGDDRHVAMPLDAVTRLERIDVSVLESVAGATVMQYRGRITPAVDLARLLGEPATSRDERAVVVCARDEKVVALVATEVVDIVDIAREDRADVGGYALLGSAIVKGRVTELLDLDLAVATADAAFSTHEDKILLGAGA